MRTTILLDDALAHRFRETARARGQSLSAFLVEAGKAALGERSLVSEPFELITYGKGGVHEGVDLDRTSDLLVAEDEENYGARNR